MRQNGSLMERTHKFMASLLGLEVREYKGFLLSVAENLIVVTASYFSLKLMLKGFSPALQGNRGKLSAKARAIIKKHVKKRINLSTHESVIASGISDANDTGAEFKDIGGHEHIKETLRTSFCLQDKYSYLFEQKKSLVREPKGILLYGPPGTGKTMLAKALAAESNRIFIHITKEKLTGFLLGESEKTVAAIFSLARKLSPCIVFIDEVENLLEKRSMGKFGTSSTVYSNMLTIFLEEWDGMNVNEGITIVGATNMPGMIDPAALRRFTYKYEVPIPTDEDRRKMLSIFLKHDKVADNFDYQAIVQASKNLTGSDLKNALEQAAQTNLKQSIKQWEQEEATEEKKQLPPLTTQMVLDQLMSNRLASSKHQQLYN